MTILKFSPQGDILPILGVRLCPILNKLIDGLDEKRSEDYIKKLLKIKKDRALKFKGYTDNRERRGTLVIIYDYFHGNHNPRLLVPETEDGYFNFKIYDVDFNTEVDIEKLIERIKRLSV